MLVGVHINIVLAQQVQDQEINAKNAKQKVKKMSMDEILSNSFFRNSMLGLAYSISLTIGLIIIGVKWDKIRKALKISKSDENS